MDRRILIGGGFASLAAGPALAQQKKAAPSHKQVPIDDIFPYLDKFLAMPPGERNHVTLAYFMTTNGKPPPPGMVALVGQGQRLPLVIGPDGRVTSLPSLAQIRGGYKVEAPAGTPFSVNLQFQPNTPPAERVPTAPLQQSLTQLNAAIRKQAGLLKFAAPKMEVVVAGGPDVSGWAIGEGGRETPLPRLQGKAPYYEPAAMKGVTALRFSKVPAALMMGPKG